MTSANLFALLQSRFPEDPDAVFLECPDLENRAGGVLTYGEADVLSARMAATLRGMGVVPGERVVVQVDKSAQAVALYLACLRVGAIYIPLNTAYTAAELNYFLGDAEPRVLVCQPSQEQALRALAEG